MSHGRSMPPRGLPDLAVGQLIGGFSSRRRKRLSLPVARDLGLSIGDPVATLGIAEIYTPSSRLRLSFGLIFLPESASIPAPSFVGSVWQAVPQIREPVSHRYGDIQDLFQVGGVSTPRPLPDGYEADSAAEKVRIHAQFAGTGQLGTWWLSAQWEPNTPIPEPEIDHLFADVDLIVLREVVTGACHVAAAPVLAPFIVIGGTATALVLTFAPGDGVNLQVGTDVTVDGNSIPGVWAPVLGSGAAEVWSFTPSINWPIVGAGVGLVSWVAGLAPCVQLGDNGFVVQQA